MMDKEEDLFKLLEQLYTLNCGNWKRRILMIIIQKKQVSYKMIKQELLEVPDMLVYKCIRELMKEKIIQRKEAFHKVSYSLLDEEAYINGILRGDY